MWKEKEAQSPWKRGRDLISDTRKLGQAWGEPGWSCLRWRKERRTEVKAGKVSMTPSRMKEGPVRRSERGLERKPTEKIAIVCPGRVPRDKVALEWKLVTIQLPVPEEGLNCLT